MQAGRQASRQAERPPGRQVGAITRERTACPAPFCTQFCSNDQPTQQHIDQQTMVSSQGLNTLVILVSWCCSCCCSSCCCCCCCCAQFGYVFDLRRFFIAWPVYFFGGISKICIANVTKGLWIAAQRIPAINIITCVCYRNLVQHRPAWAECAWPQLRNDA